MHIADALIPNKWTKLSDYTEVDADGIYYIFNTSVDDDVYFIEGDTTPTSTTVGIIVNPGNYVKYKKGSQANLYMRNGIISVAGAPDKQSKITINKVG